MIAAHLRRRRSAIRDRLAEFGSVTRWGNSALMSDAPPRFYALTGANRLHAATVAADEGSESLRTGEHIVLPDPQDDSPFPPEMCVVDTTTFLAFVAAHTKSVRLGTGMIVLPLRTPLVLAVDPMIGCPLICTKAKHVQ